MKQVHFEKVWRWPLSEASYEEYPAGTEAIVSDERAAKAQADGVLKGEPKDAPAENTASRENAGAAKSTGPKA